MHFDVFNGDADGICALHQLRLANPVENTLVTGVKRDISLLKQVMAELGDQVTVLDIAMSKNLDALNNLLEKGVAVEYFDHHIPGDIPDHPKLKAHIDTSASVCTSLLVDQHLAGRFRVWAVTAAFGDNLHDSARQAAQDLNLSATQLDSLRELGECLNYNAYGESTDDLFFHPAELFRRIHAYADPFQFIQEASEFGILKNGYAEDMQYAMEASPASEPRCGKIFILPEAPWARRISGVYGNELATNSPQLAHAILTRKKGGGFLVSVRAPLATKSGADELCSQFETGGGRKGAAGINHLPEDQLSRFENLFAEIFRAK